MAVIYMKSLSIWKTARSKGWTAPVPMPNRENIASTWSPYYWPLKMKNWMKRLMLDRKKASWQDILQRLSESDLRNFVFQLAEDNRDLQKKIVLDFSRGKSSVQEMHRYEREIDRVLAPYDLLGYIEYNASKAFADKVLDYLSSTIPPLIKRSCTMEALELVNIMAANVADISFEDEDDQQLCLDECRAYWADIIGHAKPEDVPKLHQWFIQQMDAIKNKGNELYGYYEEVLYNDFDDPASLKWKLERIDAEIEHYESTKSDQNDSVLFI